jgi:hypothetical protein
MEIGGGRLGLSEAYRQSQKFTEIAHVQAQTALKTCSRDKITVLKDSFSATC